MTDIMKISELPESLQIKSEIFTHSFNSIQLSMKEYWKEPLHTHYTRHDLEHSHRIIIHLGHLLKDNKDLLNEQERFILLAAALLHDIGMQGAKYAGFEKETNFTIEDLEKIREVHHETSAKMITDSMSEGTKLKLGLEKCIDYADFIADVAKYHRKLDLKVLKVKHFEGEAVRLPLLASLLRFGDALDQDHRRVNVEQLSYREIPVESKYYWWSHHFCSSVEIQDGRIRIHFRFPKKIEGQKIVDAFKGSVKKSVQDQLWEVYQALWNYKVKLNTVVEIGDVDYSGSSKLKIPSDLFDYLKNHVLKIKQRVEGLTGTSGAVWEVDGVPYSDNKEIAQSLDNIMRLSSEGKNREALEEIKKARILSKTPMQTMVFSLQAGNINYTLGNFEEALKYYDDVLNLSAKEAVRNVYGDETLRFKSSALGNIGLVYKSQGNPKEALKNHKQALEIDHEIGYLQGEANQLNNIGIVYGAKCEQDEALLYYIQALEIYEKIGYLPGVAIVLGNIGTVHRFKGNLDEALKYHKQALEIERKIGSLQGEASVLGNISIVFQDKGELDEALKYCNQALDIDRKIGFLQGEASDLGNIGTFYQNKGELDEAYELYRQALEIHKKIGSRQGEASVLGNIGIMYKSKGKPDEALKYYRQALKIDHEIGYLQGEANQLGNIAIVYQDKGELNEALTYYKQAVEIYKKIGYPQGEANQLGNIGTMYQDKGESDEALKYYKQALEIDRKIGYLQGEGSTLGNIGTVYQDKSEPEEALKYHKQALEIHKKIGYLEGEADQLGNIGIVYRAKRKPDEALKYYRQALEIYKKIGSRQGEASIMGNIGIVYHDKDETEEAINYILKALSISIEIDYKWSIVNSHSTLCQLYLEAGDKDKSDEHLKEFEKLALLLRKKGYKI